MNALQNLSGSDKNLLTPLILLTPWANSNKLSNSIDRVDKANDSRPFFLSLDWGYRIPETSRPSITQFQNLRNPLNCFESWSDFVSEITNVIPIVQHSEQSIGEIRQQVQSLSDLGRGIGFRIVRDGVGIATDELFSALGSVEPSDTVIFVDTGWSRDLNTLETWLVSMVRTILDIDENFVIIPTSGDFPIDFTRYTGIGSEPIGARNMFDSVRRRHNDATLIFGDYGSTRPRRYDQIASTPLPRIDYPRRQYWHIARNKVEEWDFPEAARAIMNHSSWEKNDRAWGTLMIQNTAAERDDGIATPPQAASTRINLHLHVQANFSTAVDQLELDDDWED